MGTRAAFWLGNPCDLDNRQWLGCIAWDGMLSNFADMAEIDNEEDYLKYVLENVATRKDFADPRHGGWPFPWADDVFLTDCTYAFYNDRVHACWFWQPLEPLADYLARDNDDEDKRPDALEQHNVPAPDGSNFYDCRQPDSIMMFTIKGEDYD